MPRLRTAVLGGLALAALPGAAVAAPTMPALTPPASPTNAAELAVAWAPVGWSPFSVNRVLTLRRVTGATTVDVPVPDTTATGGTFTAIPEGVHTIALIATETPCLVPPVDPAATECAPGGLGAETEGAVSATVQVTVDRTAPTGTISLDGGAAYTRDAVVATGLIGADARTTVTRMVLAATAAGTVCAAPLTCGTAFAANPSFTLTGPDGLKTVHARLVDAAGNVMSTTLSDSITLDTTAPDMWGSTSDDVLTVEAGATVGFRTKRALDATSGIDEATVAWSFCAGCAPTLAGRTVQRTFPTPGSYLVTLSAKDRAGNTGDDAFTLTVVPPAAPAPAGGGGTGGTTPAPQTPPASSPAAGATGGANPPATTRRTRKTPAANRILSPRRVGAPLRVRVVLVRRGSVTVEVLRPVPGAEPALVGRWLFRNVRKGVSILRLPAPTSAGERTMRVRANNRILTIPFRVA